MQWVICFMRTKLSVSLCCLLLLCCLPVVGQAEKASPGIWKELTPGLWYAGFEWLQAADRAKLDISVLRIDPGHYRFRLLSASEQEDRRRTIKGWVHEFDLTAGINAGMFWKDLRTSTGFMKNFEHQNNSIIHQDYGAFFAFNPVSAAVPPVALIDRELNPEWKSRIQDYWTVVQNYRMISLDRENAWMQSQKKYSVAAVGMDRDGLVLFIFSRQPSSIHDLNRALLDLPINIRNCMFVEGGSVASMYVKSEAMEREWAGVHKNTFWSEVPGSMAQIPNVIGIVAKE